MIGVAVLGSTGSIGASTLDVLAQHREEFRVVALAANRNTAKLAQQVLDWQPDYAVLADPAAARELSERVARSQVKTRVLAGSHALAEVAALAEVEHVVAAIVGAAGLESTLAAARAGKRLLLANKESLVMAGPLLLAAVRNSGATLIPVDSEHSAIFQCLPPGSRAGEAPEGVRRVMLTASGGPFLDWSAAALEKATPEQACAHPNWVMGRKISVDSATLMNKGLELIEACLLFGLAPDQVEIVIHRQSIVHSMVEYVDGSVLAQLGSPDMRTPIAHALAWPKRLASGVDFLDLIRTARLDFCAPDSQRFRCLALAQAVARSGGLEPAILNAANEVAVQAFLERRLNFPDIPGVIEAVLKGMNTGGLHSLEDVLAADAEARSRAHELVRNPAQARGVPRMNVAWQLLWFIVAVGLLVTVHEFGHYWVARRLGFKVLRFSIGFGKPLWKRVAGADQTEYVVAALPLGGYVKMLDEREGPVDPAELHRSFTRKPPWQRIVVLLAGPAFNIAFAILVLWGMFWANGTSELRAVVGDVARGSPAAIAGLAPGDEIVSLNGAKVAGRSDVVFGLLDAMSTDGSASLEVRGRGGEARNARIAIADAQQRLKLTEPAELFRGIGFEFWEPFALPQLGEVKRGGPADQAGLKAGDLILSVNDKAVSYSKLADVIAAHAGESLLIHYRRGTLEQSLRVTPVVETVDGKLKGRIQVAIGGQAGVKFPESMRLHTDLGPVGALQYATTQAWDMTALQARLVWRMLIGNVSFKNLSGPLSIAEYAGESATYGVSSFLGFLVLISLSLGFLNLLPIPILDGGQIVFQVVEWLKGTPLSERAQVFGQQIGIALLVLLMGVALFNDIARQFS